MNVPTIRMLSFRQQFNDTRIKFGVDESSTTVGNFLQVLTLLVPRPLQLISNLLLRNFSFMTRN